MISELIPSNKSWIIVIEILTGRTKDLIKILELLKINNEKIVILCEKGNQSIYLSSRNIKNVSTKDVDSFSTYDIANSSFLLTDKNSIEYLNEKLD